ncbi:protein hunchback [Gossypium australe]|uniref:Protein hunchback n=1 Tax=Gossypium australe TaxID=47621 RepID=A0A5B6V263_9ROSI|nr:protein hunchback [Gossypium australe]
MIMVPAGNLSKQQHLPHGSSDGGGFYGYCGRSYTESFGLMSSVPGHGGYHSDACLGSDLGANSMAEDESRTNSTVNEGSSSKDNNQEQEEPDKGWLQLSIGGQATAYEYDHNKHDQGDPASRRGGLMELDLLPAATSQQSRPLAPIFHMPEFRPPPPPPTLMHSFSTLFFQHQQGSSSMIPHHGELSWAFKPIAATPSSTSSYLSRPFQVQSMDVAGPSSEVRIIDPPRRPHSGIWFMLEASRNQAKEPFLPQIPKSYLRIKDGKMTVRLLMKYVANKLRLDSESEIEIRCKGRQLQPLLTLQHVRDQIWSSRQVPADYTSTTPDDIYNNNYNNSNVMVLHYGRS